MIIAVMFIICHFCLLQLSVNKYEKFYQFVLCLQVLKCSICTKFCTGIRSCKNIKCANCSFTTMMNVLSLLTPTHLNDPEKIKGSQKPTCQLSVLAFISWNIKVSFSQLYPVCRNKTRRRLIRNMTQLMWCRELNRITLLSKRHAAAPKRCTKQEAGSYGAQYNSVFVSQDPRLNIWTKTIQKISGNQTWFILVCGGLVQRGSLLKVRLRQWVSAPLTAWIDVFTWGRVCT